jgi:PKD repeat protein
VWDRQRNTTVSSNRGPSQRGPNSRTDTPSATSASGSITLESSRRAANRRVATVVVVCIVALSPVAVAVAPASASETGDSPEIGIERDGDKTVTQGGDVTFTAYPYNNGPDKEGIELTLYVDENGDNQFAPSEAVATKTFDLQANNGTSLSFTYDDVDLEPGDYTTRFEATHDGETYVNYNDATLTVETDEPAPKADIRVLSRDGVQVEVSASGTQARSGSIVEYGWDFGDGSTGTGITARNRYAEPGEYTVTLTVTDTDGQTDTVERTIEVEPDDEGGGELDLRSIEYGETATGYVNENDSFDPEYLGGFDYEPVTFTGSEGDEIRVTGDPEEAGRYPAIRVRGPNEFLERTESGSFVLPADGEYTIQAGFIGPGEGQYDLTLERIGGEAPAVTISVDGDPTVAQAVEFTAETPGSESIESYEWDFGDGSTGAGSFQNQLYDEAGEYTVEVTVTDAEGDTATATRTITVETELTWRFDDDDDGTLEMGELQDALEAVRGGDGPGDVTVEEIREKIEELNDGDEDEDTGTTDSDGDGIPDEREEKGIPVLSTYQYSDAGEDVNITDPPENEYPDFVLEFVTWIKTDPEKADTDGDGLDDGTEIARKLTLETDDVTWLPSSYDGNVTVYVLNSDPTDPNTDDTGLNDKREGKVGSDPTTPESLSVNVVVPVTGKDDCEPVTGDGAIRNCAETFSPGDVTGLEYDSAYELQPTDESSGDADWLSEVETDSNKKYWLVKVVVDVSYDGLPRDERPSYIQFTGLEGSIGTRLVAQGPNKSRLNSGYATNLDEQGGDRQTVLLVIEGGESYGVKEVGRLRARFEMEDDWVLSREGDSGDAYVSMETPLFIPNNIAFTSEDEARQMVKEGTRKWAQGTIAAVAPTGGGVAKAVGGTGAKLVVEGYATLSGVGNAPPGQDELIGQAVVSEGTVPSYLEGTGDADPTSNVAIIFHREN